MKLFSPPAIVRSARTSGVALIAVLAILVLVLGIAVAMLTMAGTERRSASVFLNTADVRVMADNAVSIVQAQINQATTGGTSVAWASQPGMVRTYQANGSFLNAYKLYSAATMTQSDVTKIVPTNSDDAPPPNWAAAPALWTDLNSPVSVLNPASTSAADQYTSVYPIVDPTVLNSSTSSQPPEGFSLKGVPGDATDKTAPMPVRWLYVLQSGTIISPDPVTSTAAKLAFTGSPVPTAANPIVGRIAFWTDDDSCKVNLNTAGGGGATATTPSNGASGPDSLWDTPHFYTNGDLKFATSQPVNGEFQRYPGHPAMTTLSAVFPQIDTDPKQNAKKILSTITPRYQWGGSEQGTVDTYKNTTALNNGVLADGPLYANANELMFQPSRSQRAANPNLTNSIVQKTAFFLTADSRAPESNLFNLPRVTCWPISSSTSGRFVFDKSIAFCATLDGAKAGENLYYFQRRSALDNSTSPASNSDVNIQRNREIFSYLQRLTNQTIPGFNVKLSDKYKEDNDQILTEIWDYIRCTNLCDTRLATVGGVPFTPVPSSTTPTPGSGYAVPLEYKPTGGTTTYRGFGRSITLSELAFVFICTADPVDTLKSGPKTGTGATTADPNGMLGSNEPATNRTLGGQKLTYTPTGASPSAQRRVQLMIVPKFFSPSLGEMPIQPTNLKITITGLSDMTLAGQKLFDSTVPTSFEINSNLFFNKGYSRRTLGGEFDYRSILVDSNKSGISDPSKPGLGYLDATGTSYPFISNFVTVKVTNPAKLGADGTLLNADAISRPGMMELQIPAGLTVKIDSAASGTAYTNVTQNISVVPTGQISTIPIPNLVRTGSTSPGGTTTATKPQYWWAFSRSGPVSGGTLESGTTSAGRLSNMAADLGSFPITNGVALTTSGSISPQSAYWGSLLRAADNLNSNPTNIYSNPANYYYTDVVRSMVPAHGDMRLICALDNVPDKVFTPLGPSGRLVSSPAASSVANTSDPWASYGPGFALMHHLVTGSASGNIVPASAQDRRHYVIDNPVVYTGSGAQNFGQGGFAPPMFRDDDKNTLNTTTADVIAAVKKSGDYDNGTVYWNDGAYINKPDEGSVYNTGTDLPYFNSNDHSYLDSKSFFSPNRMIAGPGMFGSLPTHVKRYEAGVANPEKHAWQTLLFRKQPGHLDDAGMTPAGLPAGTIAPDHLLMDLFWMPTVEPYAISEPFSTAGKINMNYQIQPFTYINRKTGMYAVLDREKIVAVPNSDYVSYKAANSTGYPTHNPPSAGGVPDPNQIYRLPIKVDETLEQFDNRFKDSSGRLFLSPTELCDQWLVPQGKTLSNMSTYWSSYALTGDNMRERPYTTIIPRLTTKSNTFTVHYRVQVLKSPSSVNPATWEEAKGTVSNEHRGSTTIQRFIDLNDDNLQKADFAKDPAITKTLDDFVRWRVINTRQFAP